MINSILRTYNIKLINIIPYNNEKAIPTSGKLKLVYFS